MENLHIHEVLRNLQVTNKTFSSKEEFASYIEETFGKDARFFACSAEGMDANAAYEFLIYKGKIIHDEQIKLSPEMTMCDGG